MSKPEPKDPQGQRFNTHIPEPRWQQIASLIVLALIIIAWIWFASRH